MNIAVNCPRCGKSLDFDITAEYQGENFWSAVVEGREPVSGDCDCELGESELHGLEEKACEIFNERETGR